MPVETTNLETNEAPSCAEEPEAQPAHALCECHSIQGMRESNQDRVVAGRIILRGRSPITYVVVADGMGGHEGGETASTLAAHAASLSLCSQILDSARSSQGQDIPEIILKAFQEANMAVMAEAARNGQFREMGTTLTMAVLIGATLYTASVGDSRCYLFHQETFEPLTRDDSFVQILVDQALLTREQAENHPRANELTRCLGSLDALDDFSVAIHELQPGDCAVLCSDGLWKGGEADIQAVCSGLSTQPFTPASLRQAARGLTRRALDRGSDDNISVGLIWLDAGCPAAANCAGNGSDNAEQ